MEKKKLHVQVGKTLVKEETIVNIAPTPKELHVPAKYALEENSYMYKLKKTLLKKDRL